MLEYFNTLPVILVGKRALITIRKLLFSLDSNETVCLKTSQQAFSRISNIMMRKLLELMFNKTISTVLLGGPKKMHLILFKVVSKCFLFSTKKIADDFFLLFNLCTEEHFKILQRIFILKIIYLWISFIVLKTFNYCRVCIKIEYLYKWFV